MWTHNEMGTETFFTGIKFLILHLNSKENIFSLRATFDSRHWATFTSTGAVLPWLSFPSPWPAAHPIFCSILLPMFSVPIPSLVGCSYLKKKAELYENRKIKPLLWLAQNVGWVGPKQPATDGNPFHKQRSQVLVNVFIFINRSWTLLDDSWPKVKEKLFLKHLY